MTMRLACSSESHNDLLTAGILDYHPPLGSWGADRQQVVLTNFGQNFRSLLLVQGIRGCR